MASSNCMYRVALANLRMWSMQNVSVRSIRLGAKQCVCRSKVKTSKGWLCRLTGLGTGLSLCAKPAFVPVDESKNVLDIDPKSLSHSNLIKNASTVAVDAASALVTQSVIAAIELYQQQAKYVYAMITLYEDQIIQVGVPHEEYIWQQIIAERVKADDAKRAAEEVECVLQAAIRTLENAGEAAYQAGSETASIIAGQRVTLAHSQLEVAKAISNNALQELARIQELSITETTKKAEQESEEQQQPTEATAAA